MACIVIRLFPEGRVERLEEASSWKEREELLGFALHLQPGLAALDVAARIWSELRDSKSAKL